MKFKKPGAFPPVFLLVATSVVVASFAIAYAAVTRKGLSTAGVYVCNLVASKHILGRDALENWRQGCRHEIRQGSFKDAESLAAALQKKFDEIPVSHLNLFGPRDEEFISSGRALHSGLWSVGVNGRYFISGVHPDSDAFGKIHAGDEVLSVNGHVPTSEVDVAQATQVLVHPKGTADDVQAQFTIEGRDLKVDAPPQLTALGRGLAFLKVSSFRKENFEKASWLKVAQALLPFRHVVVDLRGNRGGDFVAMTRALSVFACDLQDFGFLQSPQVPGDSSYVIQDQEDDQELLARIGMVRSILLKPFPDYPCYKGKVSILQDQRTGSVAEMFILNMKRRPGVQTFGRTTSGQVMLAVWYGLETIGRGYNVSIPEARFENIDGKNYDRVGVNPDFHLQVLYEDAERGEDSWLLQAVGIHQESGPL